MEEDIVQIKSYLSLLYQDIKIATELGDETQEPYVGVINEDCTFSLSWNGFENYLNLLINYLFQDRQIEENWSQKGIRDLLDSFLIELANIKFTKTNLIDDKKLSDLAIKLRNQLKISFKLKEYYVPVHGLVIRELIQLGDVKIWPIEKIIIEWNGKKDFGFLKELSINRDSVASSMISAESYKAGLILQEKVEKVLNILRYFAAIIYWDRPTQYAFLDGRVPSRTSTILNWERENSCAINKLPMFTPIPIELDDLFISIASQYGFGYINEILHSDHISPIENILLNSIYWYGDATQDINPLSSFMKYYTSLESLIKEQTEYAGQVIPKRSSWILDGENPKKRKNIRKKINSLIVERNNIFHQGIPLNNSAENLSNEMHNFSRNVIYNFTILTQKEKWQTKDDFLSWINNKAHK